MVLKTKRSLSSYHAWNCIFKLTTNPRLLGYPTVLEREPFQLWNLELEALKDSYAPHDWTVFCAYMKKSFDVVAPERRARIKFDNLRQTGDVESFANELRGLVRIMSPVPMVCPSEGDITRGFIDGCKPDIKAWLVAHTPDPYWKSSDDCDQFAINRAANRIDEHRTDTFAPRRLAAMDRNSQRTRAGRKKHYPDKPPFEAGHRAAQAMARLAEAPGVAIRPAAHLRGRTISPRCFS